MKSRVIFLFFLFMALNSSLYAFSNKYFSVTDKGWKLEKKSDKEMCFVMNDYIPEEGDATGLVPLVSIKIEGEDKLYKAKYDNEELKTFEKEIKNKAFKDYMEMAKKGSRQFLEKNYRGATKAELNKIIDKVYEDSGIKSSSISRIGDSKAYKIEFKVAGALFRRFVIASLHRVTIVEFTYPESADIDSLKPYKDFVSSFKNNDKEASSLNVFIYGSLGKNLLRIIIFVVIGLAGTIFKKLKGQ